MEDLYIVGWEETDRVSKSTSPPALPLPLQHLHLLQGEGNVLEVIVETEAPYPVMSYYSYRTYPVVSRKVLVFDNC